MAKISMMNSSDPTPSGSLYSANNPAKTGLDIRDRLAELITGGNIMSSQDRSNTYSDLASMVGEPLAQKLIIQTQLHGQRPEVKKLGNEARIQSFYDIGSSDPEVQKVLTHVKNMGYGVVPGYRQSISTVAQKLTGRLADAGNKEIPEETKKILVRVNKK